VLAAVSAIAIAGAVVLGALGTAQVGWGLAVFIVVGVLLVVTYNLELGGARLHNGTMFALGWGAFPLLTAYYAQAASIRPAAVVGAAFAFGLSSAQRELSLEAREVRRHVVAIEGERTYSDGTRRPISHSSILRPLERGLIALSWSTCLLGISLVLVRTGH
jgi:hypothetical protein